MGLKTKRAVDVITASLALVVLAPAFALIPLAIWFESGAPMLFRQTRVGHRGRYFTIYKFRTMRLRAGGALTVTKGDPRLTKLGYWLRTFSLDELPQFVNVLRGDMSLVGPRPLLPEQMAPIVRDHPRRLDMLPGMTNLPAIHGRNSLGFQERMALDVWYVEHWTPMLDCRIVLKTLWIIMRGAGVYASGAPRN